MFVVVFAVGAGIAQFTNDYLGLPGGLVSLFARMTLAALLALGAVWLARRGRAGS